MEQERSRGMSAQAFGLTLIAVVMAVVMVLTLFLFGSEDLATFLVATVVAASGALVTWRFDSLWARIVGLVITIAVGVFTFWFAFGVFQLFSPLEFITGLGYAIGLLFALVGGVVGMFRTDTTGGRLRTGALALIGVASVVSVVGFFLATPTVSEAEAAGATVLDMVDFEFTPGSTTVAADGKLLLTNSDPFAHDLTLEEYDVYTYLGPGGETLVDVSDVPPGTYEFFCSLHTFEENGVKDGMVGTITIES